MAEPTTPAAGSGAGHLTLDGLTKTYPGQHGAAVRGIDLTVERGSMLAVLGPSGCGKSTTLRMIAGLIEPTAGRVLVDGRDITGVPVHRRDMGMVFQSYALFPHLDVARNVAFGLEMRKVSKAERERRVAEALDLVRLGHLAGRRIAQLSGGQQQRVALARALVVRPTLLLLDEPLSNLDAQLRGEMRDEIRRIQRETGITAVFVTHDQHEALSMADRVAVLARGRLEQIGSPEDVYERPEGRFVARFVGRANLVEGTVTGSDGDRTVVELPGVGRVPALGEPRAAGSRAAVLLRPHRITLAPVPTAGGDASAGPSLRGTVLSAGYSGESVAYRVRVGADGPELDVERPAGAEAALAPGTEVALGWDVSAARLVDSAAAADEADADATGPTGTTGTAARDAGAASGSGSAVGAGAVAP
ncbi:ABC transporter ATP-binding protein [Streptomyces griseoviridis]|uniref:ABC transporter ATP-binding protein n=1 Tax=Streptomyces TaxID=1883 RepID=UPI002472EE13|nr:ABC transporter ATP-binding protein [Streptomyces sp. MAA16]MDH6699274.1 putative spermidine/putrescine transport system ATP-binding protein [Streptomyces sp. MAA16]